MWFLYCLFCLWAVISILSQTEARLGNWLKGFDLFGLIPNWKFFAPNPVQQDSYLYYRDHFQNGISPWHRAFDGDKRLWSDPLWSPLRREEKAITDCMFHLLDQIKFVEAERIQFSTSCLMVLSFINSIPNDNDAVARQFLMARRLPGHPAKPVFMSNIHVLSNRSRLS